MNTGTQPRVSTLKSALMRQFGHPRGPLGQLAGMIMALRASNRVRNRWTVEQLEIGPSDRVLEIGYGPGIGVAHAARRATRGRVVGVDVSEVMHRQAERRNRAGIASGRVSLHVGTIDDLNPEHPFTAAMAVNVFMFWPHPVGVLRRLSGLLTPGAKVALTMQPRGTTASNATTAQAGQRIAATLHAAGYTDVEARFLPLKPVDAVCVLGRSPG